MLTILQPTPPFYKRGRITKRNYERQKAGCPIREAPSSILER
jgi:hypothetical protein